MPKKLLNIDFRNKTGRTMFNLYDEVESQSPQQDQLSKPPGQSTRPTRGHKKGKGKLHHVPKVDP